MNGYKTIIAALMSVLGGLATMSGFTLSPEQIAEIATNLETFVGSGMVLYGVAMAGFRAITKSPMFNGKRPGGNINSFIIPLFLVGLMLSLVGCSAGFKPDTPAEHAATAYVLIDKVAQATAQNYQAGLISADKKREIKVELIDAVTQVQTAEYLVVDGLPGDSVAALVVINQRLLVLLNQMKRAQ